MRVSLVPATKDDFMSVHGALPPVSVRAFAGHLDDGTVLGVGGIGFYKTGQHVAFVKLLPEARKYPIALHKAALRTFAIARENGIRKLIAVADDVESEAAERWLLRLGFVRHTIDGQVVYELDFAGG